MGGNGGRLLKKWFRVASPTAIIGSIYQNYSYKLVATKICHDARNVKIRIKTL